MRLRHLLVVLGLLGAAVPAAPADNPFATPPVDGLIPVLPGATLPLPSAPNALTGAALVHEGRMTWGGDLADPGTGSPMTWQAWFAPAPGPLRYTAAPTFPVRVGQAQDAAESHLTALDPAAIGDVFGLFEKLGDYMPGASASVSKPDTPRSFFFGYRPLRARWLGGQWWRPGPFLFQPEKHYSYADYAGFRDVRMRGARLYCAARKAQLEQAGLPASLGERVGFSVSLVGHTIDFLVIEPTLALDGPERFTGAAGDLSRAFRRLAADRGTAMLADVSELPRLAWRWRVEGAIDDAEVARPDGRIRSGHDDFAAKLAVLVQAQGTNDAHEVRLRLGAHAAARDGALPADHGHPPARGRP